MAEEDYADALLAELFTRAKAQFGAAVKSYWFYGGDTCPGCGSRQIEPLKHKGKDALSLNAFIYRERGVLIGYLLCRQCAKDIFRAARKNPYQQTPLHTTIEQNLIKAYRQHLGTLDA
jgi:hypothetical protein